MLYFLPHINRDALFPMGRLDRMKVASRGLGDVLDDVRTLADCTCANVTKGPGGLAGVLLCFGAAATGFHASQKWESAADPAALWLGFADPNDPPGPEQLARKKQYKGYDVELCDGRKWHVPIVRRYPNVTSLPMSIGWDADGQFQSTVAEKYAALWSDVSIVLEGKSFEAEWGLDLAIRALAVNYRYDRHAQRMLQLIDSEKMDEILRCAADIPFLEEMASKKKDDQE